MTDYLDMGISPTTTLIILIFTCGTAAVSILSIFSNIIGHETQLHDLRNRVKDMHYQHLLYMARQDNRIPEKATKQQNNLEITSQEQNVNHSEGSSNPETQIPVESSDINQTAPLSQAA